MTKQYGDYKKALQDVKKPCAFIDDDALRHNIEKISKQANGKNIRIATKSVRSVAILKRILNASSVYRGLMCFTGEEAMYLFDEGFNDLLIAYPVWDEATLQSIGRYTKNGAHITLMVDSIAHINRLENIAKAIDGSFYICLDVDMSTTFLPLHFGVYRSSLRTLKDVKELVKYIKNCKHLQVDGMMGYEAQIAGVTDNDPNERLKGTVVRQLKRKSLKEIRKKRKKIATYINKQFPQLRFINGGGTGSLQFTTKEKNITEVTVGSGFYQSHLFDKYKDFTYRPAAGYVIEITRIPEKGIYTCYGGGYVASGASGHDRLPEVYLPKEAKLTKNEGVGEVQTPILYNGKIELKHGDPIFLRHSKAGELCERFNSLHIINGDKHIDTVSTYRGDGKCFL